ncbi:hypothetical protein KAI32_01765 [Candidatus Pacearchaeota archaeon]|nr:hypothetical protein [Candidatus Pacearchaeota archaeon]
MVVQNTPIHNIEVPDILTHITGENYGELKPLKEGLILNLDNHSLRIFNTPFYLAQYSEQVCYVSDSVNWNDFRLKSGNVGLIINKETNRKNNLQGKLSNEFVKLNLEDLSRKKYKVRCEKTYLIESHVLGDNSYFLNLINEQNLKEISLFGAKSLLNELGNFHQDSIDSLSNFILEDYETQKHTLESISTEQGNFACL